MSSMHDARDAEDNRLLASGEYSLLVQSYYGLILGRCRARIWDEADAIGVAAEVVIRLLNELKRGRRYTVPFRVVVNQVVTWKLKEHFAARSVEEVELGDAAAPDEAFAAFEAEHDLRLLLNGLPAREREVALLRVGSGLAPDRIAAELGITRNNVDQAWHRAKAKLRERLAAPT
jgi:RNA polymerase sigma factor (sigma-70 family)